MDYEVKDDGMAEWKVEIEGWSEEEKREELKKMRFDEEAEMVHLEADARANLARVEKIRGRYGGGSVGKEMKRQERREETRKEEGKEER